MRRHTRGQLPSPKVIVFSSNSILSFSRRHPVVTSFLWRKWQNISNDVRQNLRSGGIFTITATRAILTAFDAKLDRTMDDEENNNTTSNNNNMTSTSCHTQDHWFWNPANGTFKLHRKDDWEVGTVSTLLISLWLVLLILRSCIIQYRMFL